VASIYQDFGRALLASERPKKLSKAELEQYNVLLEEQAYPFEEKAIGIHADNAHRAAAGVYDQWVHRSFIALAEMNPARYDRDETLDMPVVAVPAAAATAPAVDVTPALAAARAALDSGDAQAAAKQAEAALAIDPANPGVLNTLGVARRQLGQFPEARAAYERAIAADPTYSAPRRNCGVLLDLYLGDSAAALPYYEQYQALTSGTDPKVGSWLVELRTRLGHVSRTAEAQP
jgi:cellulose synthase operon protein C